MATEIKITNKVKELARDYEPTINYYKDSLLNDIMQIEAESNESLVHLCDINDWSDMVKRSVERNIKD